MKFSNAILAILASALPTAFSLPTELSLRQNKLPTCGAEKCLVETPGVFDACPPGDLACLCTLQQSEVSRYVITVQPCLDGPEGKEACTDGAIYQYKKLLHDVCAEAKYGNKSVEFPGMT